MLTLRYDPFYPKDLTKIADVTTDQILAQRKGIEPIPNSLEIEKALRNVIKYSVETNKADHIAVALSTGVDSNLIFSLIRDEFPAIDIDCYSVGFYDDHVFFLCSARH